MFIVLRQRPSHICGFVTAPARSNLLSPTRHFMDTPKTAFKSLSSYPDVQGRSVESPSRSHWVLGNVHNGDLRASQSCLLTVSECADPRSKRGERGHPVTPMTLLPGCLHPSLHSPVTSVHPGRCGENDKRNSFTCYTIGSSQAS